MATSVPLRKEERKLKKKNHNPYRNLGYGFGTSTGVSFDRKRLGGIL